MRQLLPVPLDDVDLADLLDRDDQEPQEGRPWVKANMVASVDGAYALEGRSGALGSAADRSMFAALRAGADVILVAAGTARAERYRRPVTSDDRLLAARRSAGAQDHPRLCVVSGSLDLPRDLPLFDGTGEPPLVAHPAGADPSALPDGVEAIECGVGAAVDLELLLAGLHTRGARVVLCEGGPGLLGQLHQRDLLDELHLSRSPVLVGGRALGLLGGTEPHLRRRRLTRLFEADGMLFATYRRETAAPTGGTG